jgi:hypothetical protein
MMLLDLDNKQEFPMHLTWTWYSFIREQALVHPLPDLRSVKRSSSSLSLFQNIEKGKTEPSVWIGFSFGLELTSCNSFNMIRER